MNGSVVFSNDAPPPSLANAMSSTATRPSIFDAGGSDRGVRNANRGSVADGDDGMGPQDYSTLAAAGPRRPASRRGTAVVNELT